MYKDVALFTAFITIVINKYKLPKDTVHFVDLLVEVWCEEFDLTCTLARCCYLFVWFY